MNLKIKKRVISMLCATVMVASSMGASVGAVKTVPNCTQKFKDAVLKLNQTLTYSTDCLMQLKTNIEKLELDNPNGDKDNIMKFLFWVIDRIDILNDYYIADEDLVVEIQNEITNLNDKIIDLNSNGLSMEPPYLTEQDSIDIFNKIARINNKLFEEDYKAFLRKELDDKYNEYCKQVKEFRTWKDSNNISQESDTTYNNMLNVVKYYISIRKNVDAVVVNRFFELAEDSCEEMEQFKNHIQYGCASPAPPAKYIVPGSSQ